MERLMITLPPELRERVDAAAVRLGESRSAFVRKALALRVAALEREAFDALLAEGYLATNEASSKIVADLAPLQDAAASAWVWDEP